MKRRMRKAEEERSDPRLGSSRAYIRKSVIEIIIIINLYYSTTKKMMSEAEKRILCPHYPAYL